MVGFGGVCLGRRVQRGLFRVKGRVLDEVQGA